MGYGPQRYCRWDSIPYKPDKDIGRDGFCCDACRNAHHRAYKKWRDAKEILRIREKDLSVTRRRRTSGKKS